MKLTAEQKKTLLTSLFLGLIITAIGVHHHSVIAEKRRIEEEKLDVERKKVSAMMREQGRLLAEQQLKHPEKVPFDPLAPPEPSDQEELAQLQLWQRTPPHERKKLLPDNPPITPSEMAE